MSIKAGVIGCGNISRFHFSGLSKAEVQVAWVCDLNEAAARPWVDRFGARFTPRWQDVIDDRTVDVVTVAAFSSLHKPICLAAIAAGKAVICEKTLAVDADDALDIVRAAETAGTQFYTSYMKRFIPAVEKARELLPSLGRIVSTSIRAYQHWGNLWEANPENGFLSKPADGPSTCVRNYGGGILVCGGSHILDLVCFLLGRPHRLYATMHLPADRDYDLQAAALLETPNGICHFEALAHPLKHIGFLNDGWDERLEINGLKGRLEVFSSAWDHVEDKASKLVHYDNASGQAVEYRYAPESPFDRAIAFFIGNIKRGIQGEQRRTTGYDVDELIGHIKHSATTGTAVNVAYRI